ncbi:hypothetical protein D9M70_600800 [compost metagenome]
MGGSVKNFPDLVGHTIARLEISDNKTEILIGTTGGRLYKLWHRQDCCEGVEVYDVAGDLSDIIGSPLLLAEEVESERGEPAPDYPDSWTWTFYKLATIKGSVTIRWLGESNGYYSESVDFDEVSA